MSSQPSPDSTAFVLVPGAFCPGYYFHRVTDKLTSLGYSSHTIDLPSVGERPEGPASMADDAEHVRAAVTNFADEGKNVVLVGNSYGGIVITEASRGVRTDGRLGQGKTGGVVNLVYIASLLAPVGINVHELVGGQVPVQTESESDYIAPLDAAAGGAALCSGLSVQEQAYYGGMARCHSAKALAERLTYAGYEDIPTTVVIPTKDKALSAKFQTDHLEKVVASGMCRKGVRRVLLEADHCAMISKAEEVVEVLLEAARGGGGVGRW